jgi:hypothetical protein
MGIIETLYPYLISPMWVSLGLTVIILLCFPFIIKFVRKDIWNNFFHIPYWHAYILNGNQVLKRIIVNIDLKQLKVKSIDMKPYSWIISEGYWINFKSAFIVFLDISSCMAINLMTDDEQKLFKEIKQEKDSKKIIARIPIINRFFHSKDKYFNNDEKLVGFASKIKSNPEFIINAVTFHIFLKQKFTNDIIKVPKTIWEILEENMTLIIIVSFIVIMAFLLLSHAPNL